MASNDVAAISAFIEGAPPGEVGMIFPNPPPARLTHSLLTGFVAHRCCERYQDPSTGLHHVQPTNSAHKSTADIKALTTDKPSLLSQAAPAFQKYSEEQLTVVKLPGSGKDVCPDKFLISNIWDVRQYN